VPLTSIHPPERNRFPVVLALLLGLAFGDLLLGQRTLFYRDFGVLAYPTMAYARDSIAQGALPLWNPLSHCGVPFLAQWGTLTLYPGSVIWLLLPLPWAANVFCLLHLWLAGFGMHRLARRWTGDPTAAALAGTAFVFSGLTLSCLLWPNYTAALAWMPWVVSTACRAARHGARAVPLAVLPAALQILAGVPEILGLTWLVVFLIVLLAPPREASPASPALSAQPTPPGRGLTLVRLTAVAALAAGLTAIQWAPFVELLTHSHRDTAFATGKWALPPWGWANLVDPLFRCFPTSLGVYFQPGQEFFSSVYLGTGVVALALAGVGLVRKPWWWVLAALALAGAWLALGNHSAPYRVLRETVPPLGLARYPVKFLLLTGFAAPLLAAGTLAALKTGPYHVPRRSFRPVAIACGLVLLALAGLAAWTIHHAAAADTAAVRLLNTAARAGFLLATIAALGATVRTGITSRTAAAAIVLPVLIALDGLSHVPAQNPTLPANVLEPGLARAAASLPHSGEGRVFITPEAEDQLLNSRLTNAADDLVGKRLALWSNLNLLEGVPKVNGAATLQIREQADLQRLLYDAPPAHREGLLDFLGVTRMTAPANPTEWITRSNAMPLVTGGQQPVYTPVDWNPNALLDPECDLRTRVFLPEPARAAAAAAGVAETAVPVTFAGRQGDAHHLRVVAETPAPAWVVLAQSHYPAWRAEVNGRPARLWPANHAFQALCIPAGTSTVRIVYRDRVFWAGAALSAATAILLLRVKRRARAG